MNFDFLSKTSLFQGCLAEDISGMADRLGFLTACYKKGAVIYEEGTTTHNIGMVLSGSVQIGHNDIWGNNSILSIAKAGDVFAEAYACIPKEPLMIQAEANEPCEILFINVPKLFAPCRDCAMQNQVIQNLVAISAQKSLQLSRRCLHTSPKTIRGRLLSYFSQLVSQQGSAKIVSPFNRQQLADYLNLDRSALSKELGKMKQEGFIEYHKNTFVIKKLIVIK